MKKIALLGLLAIGIGVWAGAPAFDTKNAQYIPPNPFSSTNQELAEFVPPNPVRAESPLV